MLLRDSVDLNAWRLSTTSVRRPTVHIFGLYKSGTNALWAYLQQYFDVIVEPTSAKSGVVNYRSDTGHHICWKHHPAVDPYPPIVLPANIPPGDGNSEAVVLICVRELRPFLLCKGISLKFQGDVQRETPDNHMQNVLKVE